MVLEVCADFVFISVVAYSKVTLTGNTEVSIFDAQHSALNWPQLLMTACGATSTENNIIMYIYHALINAMSTHIMHINLNMIFCTPVEHSRTKTIYIKYYTKKKKKNTTNTYANTHTHTHTHTTTLQIYIIMFIVIPFRDTAAMPA